MCFADKSYDHRTLFDSFTSIFDLEYSSLRRACDILASDQHGFCFSNSSQCDRIVVIIIPEHLDNQAAVAANSLRSSDIVKQCVGEYAVNLYDMQQAVKTHAP